MQGGFFDLTWKSETNNISEQFFNSIVFTWIQFYFFQFFRVCVTSLWKGYLGQICVQTATAMKTKIGQSTKKSLTAARFLASYCVSSAMKTKSGQYTIEVLVQCVFWLFVVSLLQWRQNLVNALKNPYYSPFSGFFLYLRCNEDKIWSIHYRSLVTACFFGFLLCLH